MKIIKPLTLTLCFALLIGLLTGCTDRDDNEPDAAPPDETEEYVYIVNDFTGLSSEQLMLNMGAGWNLGNTLDARRDGTNTPTGQETAWGNPVTTPEMFELLVETGFKSLRIPVTWQNFIGDGPEFVIDEAFMDRVQEVVDYGYDLGLYVILNTHHENWQHPIQENYEDVKLKLIAVWEQIAYRFGGYSERLIFEGMNEPRLKGEPEEWIGGTQEARDIINGWNQAFVDTVRNSGHGNNDKRWLMVTTHAAAGNEEALKGFIVPEDDNIIVSIHAYLPYHLALNTRSAAKTFDPTASGGRDIREMFARLDKHFVSQGIPVIMGEMGCINKDNLEARIEVTEFYTAVAAEYGVPCLWWDNGIQIARRDGEESFGIMDRNNLTWWYPELAEAMVNGAMQP